MVTTTTIFCGGFGVFVAFSVYYLLHKFSNRPRTFNFHYTFNDENIDVEGYTKDDNYTCTDNPNKTVTLSPASPKDIITIKKENKMTVNDFAKKITLEEGKKSSISIAQVKEVLKLVNNALGGELYKLIRKKKK